MTGFGRGSAEADGLRAEVEIKGVNHRFLDVRLRLPAEVGSLETEVRGRVQARVGRGRVDVAASIASGRPPAYRVEVRRELVAEYLRAAASLKKEFRLRGGIALEQVLALPGALSVQVEAGAAESLAAQTLLSALDRALSAYDEMRTEEGARLAADLRARLGEISDEAGRIEAAADGLPEAYAARLRERAAPVFREHGLDEVRLAQEVALLADRVDTSEELVRLRGYVEQATAALERPPGPVGKTLDFVMQEMNREANTISSKAEALPICQSALRIKSAVEKIREQVQNLE